MSQGTRISSRPNCRGFRNESEEGQGVNCGGSARKAAVLRRPGNAVLRLPPATACPADSLAGGGFCREGPWGPEDFPFLFSLAATCVTPFNLISLQPPHRVSPHSLAGKALVWISAEPWT